MTDTKKETQTTDPFAVIEVDRTDFLERISSIQNNSSFDVNDHPSLLVELKEEWHRAVSTLWKIPMDSSSARNENSMNFDEWFQQLYQRHTERQRYYHTAAHLHEMMQYLSVLESLVAAAQRDSAKAIVPLGSLDRIALCLAIFFHDAIYDPKSAHNERDSQKLYETFWKEAHAACESKLSETIMLQLQHRVSTLILATEKHQILAVSDNEELPSHPHFRWNLSDLQKMFLDIDMAVLGKKQKAYLAYAGLIRQEYIHVSPEVYCSKRAEILQGFVNRSTPIFLTSLMYEVLEEGARSNLCAEIAMLREGRIPFNLNGGEVSQVRGPDDASSL